MSCIDLMGNTVWQDADITYYTEGLIHAKFSVIEETVLNRKLTAATIGEWTLTPEEQAQIAAYKQVCLEAHAEGVAARSDMARLNLCLDYENALERLLMPSVVDVDLAERAAAQTAADEATARLALPEVTEPELVTVTDDFGVETEIPNPAIAADAAERAAAQAALDAANERLSRPLITDPVQQTDMDGNVTEIENPVLTADNNERAEAQAVVDNASQDTLDLYAFRHPAPPSTPESPLMEPING